MSKLAAGAMPAPSPVVSASDLRITTSSPLTPAFDPNVFDYVISANAGTATQVTSAAANGVQVSIDGLPFHSQTFTAPVTLKPGQRFTIVITSPGTSNTYSVRCLPADFPSWTTERAGTPQAEYYVFSPNLSLTGATPSNYLVLVDGNGVPIWWHRAETTPLDAKVLPSGNIGWTGTTDGDIVRLDGSLVRKFAPVNVPNGVLDGHELLELPNGDLVYITDLIRGPVDLSPFGGSSTGTVIDNIIQEVDRTGAVVWQWSAMDHIPISDMDPRWRPQYLENTVAPHTEADVYHMNSVEPNGDGYVVSLRHNNAVIRIDRASGNIVWKLGGAPRAQSLTFNGDTYGNFGGQHDARILSDGTLTVHDNGSLLGRPPRAARYMIDTTARTATLIEQVTDPDVPNSVCCGDARKLAGGDWAISWGATPFITELDPTGKRILRFTLGGSHSAYRVAPAPFGLLTRDTLRQGMDAQFPR
jgi:hypothetical protein